MNTNNLSLILAKLLRINTVIEIGMETIAFAQGCQILGISNFYGYECSKSNTIDKDRIKLGKLNFNWDCVAISDVNGNLSFFDEPKDIKNNTRGLIQRSGSKLHSIYTVPAYRLQDHKFYKNWNLNNKNNNILLKIDAEGMGCRIIKDNSNILNKFSIIQLEVDDIRYFSGNDNSKNLAKILLSNRFRIIYSENIKNSPYDIIFINKKHNIIFIYFLKLITILIYPISIWAWTLTKRYQNK